ncbi:MAG: GIY-YIG nuclease family protein [Anaerolineae bacterium]
MPETREGLVTPPAQPSDATGMGLPSLPGRYVLLLTVPSTTGLITKRGRCFVLDPGVYAYVGSASGPGGLRARLGRYLTKVKRPHWHVDYLLTVASPLGAICLPPSLGECQLANLVASLPGSLPIPGFGCSDCHCRAHLYCLVKQQSISSCAHALDIETSRRGQALAVLCQCEFSA